MAKLAIAKPPSSHPLR